MLIVCSKDKIKETFGADASTIMQVIGAMGTVLDVSGKGNFEIRAAINQYPAALPACLIGGYDLLPPFRARNPTRGIYSDVDTEVLTDAPYGARDGSRAEIYLPSRAVSRIPDFGHSDAAGFIGVLTRAADAPGRTTPAGHFQEAAEEFAGAAAMVHEMMENAPAVLLSPPVHPLRPAIDGVGRVHILLHGTDRESGRAALWGKSRNTDYVRALDASELRTCPLEGAVVSFSSCYSAMLDARGSDSPRTPDNQVALASLAAGAKVVFGSTRATWLDIQAPFDSFGTALMATLWGLLNDGTPAAEALRSAKMIYAKQALRRDPQNPDRTDAWGRPYVLKTLLQSHCYGHPMAVLQAGRAHPGLEAT